MLDWIFEGIVTWISSAATKLMDVVSGLFLNALGTDMTAMEEYFPFVTKAFSAMQYTAWAILFLIFVWQLFRVFGGPVTEAENPLILLARSAIFALLIGYAKSIFMIVLNIARAPYTALMDITMSAEDFTFAGIEEVLKNGMTTLLAESSGIGTLLIAVLMISLGWNYFKLLLETVERYVVVGVLCYTSPLAYSLGGSMTTAKVFSSWCRMIGSQLLLLVMNVWFLRAFDSSVGYFIGTGGTLTTGQGSIFLWLFCALAFLKTAQRFDSYLASIGLNVAQTGSSMGMEMLMAARVIGGAAGFGGRTVGSVFKGGSGAASATATGTGAAASGFASGFASQFKGNSYVRDAVVSGGSGNMGVGGAVGFVARTFGGIAARNGASLTAESVSSVAARTPSVSGTIAGDIADRSLSNYMPQFSGKQLKGTQITGGHISTKAVGADGKSANVELFQTAQYDKPEGPHSVVTAADGSTWYLVASGAGRPRSILCRHLRAARMKRRKSPPSSRTPRRARSSARWTKDKSKRPCRTAATPCGTAARSSMNRTRLTRPWKRQTVWNGTPCSRTRKHPRSRRRRFPVWKPRLPAAEKRYLRPVEKRLTSHGAICPPREHRRKEYRSTKPHRRKPSNRGSCSAIVRRQRSAHRTPSSIRDRRWM